MLIMTRFHGPTNTRGSRVTARSPHYGVSVTVSRDYSREPLETAWEAARQLCAKLNAADGAEYRGAFVMIDYIGSNGPDGWAFGARTEWAAPARFV